MPYGGLFVEFDRSCPGAQVTHEIRFLPTGTVLSSADVESMFLRTVCHVLVERLPNEALRELSQSLSDFHDYYAADLNRSLPAPSVDRIRATSGRIYERPRIQFDEEE